MMSGSEGDTGTAEPTETVNSSALRADTADTSLLAGISLCPRSPMGASSAPLISGLRQPDLSTAFTNCSFTDPRLGQSHVHLSRPLEIMESIKGLHELHQRGGLTVEEFAQAKQQILDSGPSSSTEASSVTKSHHSRVRRKHRHHHRPGASRTTRSSNSKATTAHTRHTHKDTHTSRSRSSSSSTDSSSSSSSDQFIVVPRANVWRKLHAQLADRSPDHDSAVLRHAPSPRSPTLLHAPRLGSDGDKRAVMAAKEEEEEEYYTAQDVQHSSPRPDGYAAIPTDDPLTRRTTGDGNLPMTVSIGRESDEAMLLRAGADGGKVLSPLARGGGGMSTVYKPNSLNGSDSRDKARYGTFLHRDDAMGVVGLAHVKAELSRDDIVRVRYFNSRGATGSHFSDVELHPQDMREPFFLHKGRSQVMYVKPPRPPTVATTLSSTTRRSNEGESLPVLASPLVEGHVAHVMELTNEEHQAWAEMTTSLSSSSRSSRSSYLEQSLNWYWVDVTGRDASRKRYNAALRALTTRFKLCESFLVDRDHMLVLPQVCESPHYPGQYLLNLRVATEKIAISDDSVMELTNRWIIVVDLKQHVVITLHRVDTHSMATLRTLWRTVIENSEVSFQEFLLKIIDDAIRTYHASIDVHASILDKCEAKLFVDQSQVSAVAPSGHFVDMRILHHFAGSSRSPFLRQLLDEQNRSPMNKSEMNSFLHHLHRRTSVQLRMLNMTQTVLAKAFTKLRLCSREMADQMCGACIEVADRAMEVRDDAKTLLDLHISLQSFRTNELMAVLTRVSLLFTPMTFLAGVYGMNFEKNFPELQWTYGYPFFWCVCAVLVVLMQFFFLRTQ